MIVTHIEYNITHVLDSDDAVAICETEGAALKNLALLDCEAGWGLIVVETASGDHLVLARADGTHESNLFADARRWSREYGYQFLLKRSNERISSLRENAFVVAGDRTVEIHSTYTALRTSGHGEHFRPIRFKRAAPHGSNAAVRQDAPRGQCLSLNFFYFASKS